MASPEIALLLELVLDLKKDISATRDDISVVKDETTKNTVVLDDHARRSTASEARLDLLEKRDQMLNGFVKISAGLLGVAGTLLAVWEAVRNFR